MQHPQKKLNMNPDPTMQLHAVLFCFFFAVGFNVVSNFTRQCLTENSTVFCFFNNHANQRLKITIDSQFKAPKNMSLSFYDFFS